MPKARVNAMTVAAINATKPGEKLHDGGGLIFERTPTSVRWTFRFVSPLTGKRREAGLGSVSLKYARARAEEMRRAVRAGRDPLAEADREREAAREAEKARQRERERDAATLEACAREYHRTLAPTFRNAKHRRQWIASLEGSIPAKLWRSPIGKITADDLLGALLPLAERVPETAARVRLRLAQVFDDALLRDLADRNPAAAIKPRMRRKRGGETPHLRALDYREVPALVAALRASERVSLHVRTCLLFAVATAARSGEARGATWAEFDLAARTWTVPAARMKGGAAHVVALSDFALGLLREAEALRAHDGPDALVFPAPREPRRPLSDMALTVALRRLPTGRMLDDDKAETFGDRTTMHGLARASFSTWANEAARARPDVVEACLAHREADRVRAASNRADFERERRALLARWGAFLASERAQVVPLRRGA